MKCMACQYEQTILHEDEDKIIGSEPFILIEFSTYNAPVMTTPVIRRGWPDRQNVKLYACPRCSTVRMERTKQGAADKGIEGE